MLARPGEEITIEFPVAESTETYTLRWKREDRWFESSWPGDGWRPGSDRYTCRFRGNTLVEISPPAGSTPEGPGYPLYRREGCRKGEAPMKEVTRFVIED